MEIDSEVGEVLRSIVEAASSSANDWTHYQWQADCRSVPSESTPTAIQETNSCIWTSSSSDESTSVESDVEVAGGKAAGKMGRWKTVRRRDSSNYASLSLNEQNASISIESRPIEWPISWTLLPADPLLVASSISAFKDSENYLKGVKWAPDGSCWMSAANDNNIRLYNLPDFYCRSEMAVSTSTDEMKPVIKVNEGDSIYDYCWYPFMDSNQAHTCYFFTASKDHPIHLRDAFTGNLAGSYTARNQVDVLIAPFAIHCCKLEGKRLYAGYNRQIRVFDLERPGPIALSTVDTVERTFGGRVGQTGLISCFAQEPTGGSLLAVGCYDRSIGLYSAQEMMQFSVMTAHRAGVTHLAFRPDGKYLYSGARKDGEILCWDIRRPGLVLAAYRRVVTTNQRIYFDVTQNGKYLVSACSDGQVCFYDIAAPFSTAGQAVNGIPTVEPCFAFNAHTDCVNGVSLHPSLPLMLTSSGQRWFDMTKLVDDDSDDSGSDAEYYIPRTAGYNKKIKPENSVKLWQFEAISL